MKPVIDGYNTEQDLAIGDIIHVYAVDYTRWNYVTEKTINYRGPKGKLLPMLVGITHIGEGAFRAMILDSPQKFITDNYKSLVFAYKITQWEMLDPCVERRL